MTIDDQPLRDSFAEAIDDVGGSGVAPGIDPLSIEVLTQIRQAVCITDADLDSPGPRIEFVNGAYLDVFACEERDVLGRSPRFAQGPLTARPVLDRIREHLEAGRSIRAQAINYRVDRTPFRLRWSIDPIRRDGEIVKFVAIMNDVTVEDRMRRRLAALDTLLVAARSVPGADLDPQHATDAVAAALVPMLAEIAGATIRLGGAATTVTRADDADAERSTVSIGRVGEIDVDVHPDAGRLYDDTGVQELARHAGWMFDSLR